MQRNRGLYRESEAELHQIVVLSAGGNDIDLAGPGAPPTLEVGMALYDYAQVIMLQLHLLFARWRHCMLPHRWLRQVKPDNAMEVLKILKCTQTVLNMAEGGINWRGYDESFRAMRGMECWVWDSVNYEMWFNAGRLQRWGLPFRGAGNRVAGVCFAHNRSQCYRNLCRFKHICRGPRV